MMSDGYNPTVNLRQRELFNVSNGEMTYKLQQLWQSGLGGPVEWRDVEIIPWITTVSDSEQLSDGEK